ncbi:MAG: hypothetical protein OSA95_03120 [Opitutales bacterium]|nr:hypothetical protein [Opitutales bacterium]
MDNDGVSPQGVIDDLAEQNKRLTIDCAILRTAVKQLQAELHALKNPPLPPPPPPVIEGQIALEDDDSDKE